MILIEKYFIWMMLYSIMGWVYETIVCSVQEHRLINRGFLNGPYCPIYGTGAILVILILGHIENFIVLFLASAVVTCTLEYVTSVVMEKLFYTRWWDYSEEKFNLNGRVCLIGAIIFGIFSLVLIKVVHPIVSFYIDLIPTMVIHNVAGLLFLTFLSDIYITVKGFLGFDSKLKELSDSIMTLKVEIDENLHQQVVRERTQSVFREFLKRLNSQHRRMLNSFPKLKSIRYNHILGQIRQMQKNKKSEPKSHRE